MQLKDLALNDIPLVFFISLIIMAVRPQSNFVKIQPKLLPSEENFKVLKIKEKSSPPPGSVQQERELLPKNVEIETIAKE